MQERSQKQFEWESKKRIHIEHKTLVTRQKDEKERLEKRQKQDISYVRFKEWLKRSLIKQREDQVQKKIEKQIKKQKDEDEVRKKAHRRVLAKIAYKDWK